MKSGWIGFAGIAGVFIFLFGLLGLFFVDFRDATAILPGVHLLVGVVLLVVWFFGQGLSNLSGAGDVLWGRTARFTANATLYAVVFLAILVAINYLANRHDRRWDLTEQGVYSIAQQSKNVVGNLKAPLKVVVFKVAGGPTRSVLTISSAFTEMRTRPDSPTRSWILNRSLISSRSTG